MLFIHHYNDAFFQFVLHDLPQKQSLQNILIHHCYNYIVFCLFFFFFWRGGGNMIRYKTKVFTSFKDTILSSSDQSCRKNKYTYGYCFTTIPQNVPYSGWLEGFFVQFQRFAQPSIPYSYYDFILQQFVPFIDIIAVLYAYKAQFSSKHMYFYDFINL